MATTIRDKEIDAALDERRTKQRPVPSRARLAVELLRRALRLPRRGKEDK